PRLYASLYASCRSAILAKNPRAQVAFGPLASRGAQHGMGPLGFLAAYRAAGGIQPDVVALNPYQLGLAPVYLPKETTPDGAITLRNLDQLENALKTWTGRQVPIWLTEFAWRTAPTPHLGTISLPLQATLLDRTIALVRDHEPYVQVFIWF